MRLGKCLLAASLAVFAASPAIADVTGKVKLDGKPPARPDIDMSGVKDCASLHPDPVQEDTVLVNDKGEIANVVVSIKTDDPDALGGAIPKEPAVLDQKGCMYSPHIVAMMVGQKLLIKNSDAFAHNVHALPQKNPEFNFQQPNKDPGKEPPAAPKIEETIKVKCEVHPWMSSWLVVLPHPFFSVTKADGNFEIKGLPDGDYTLQAWHEKYGTQTQKVAVKGGKAEVNFTFKAPVAEAAPIDSKAAASLVNDSKIQLASQTTSMLECDCEKPAQTTPTVVPVMAVTAK